MLFGFLSYIDAVLLVVFIISIIVGIIKGFTRQILKIVTFFGTIILAVLATPLIVGIVSSIASPLLTPVYETWVAGIYDSTQAWTLESATGAVTLFLTDANLSLLAGPLSKFLVTPLVGQTGSFASLVSLKLVNYTSYAIAFVILLIVFGIAMGFLSRFIRKVSELPVINSINKVLGGIFSLAVVYVIILGIFLLVPLVAIIFPSVIDSVSTILEPSIIAKWMYETNWLLSLLNSLNII